MTAVSQQNTKVYLSLCQKATEQIRFDKLTFAQFVKGLNYVLRSLEISADCVMFAAFHVKNNYANVSQHYVYTYVVCLIVHPIGNICHPKLPF